MYNTLFSYLFIILVLSGCGMKSIGLSFEAERYFALKEYDAGISFFKEKIREDPHNATDHYFIGRFYLAENKPFEALPYLKKAAVLDPKKTDYRFWLGVGYGAAGEEKEERIHYEKVLDQRPSHDRARLYLAHLQLKEGQYISALKGYDRVLKRYPYNAAALYNRGLCLKFLRIQDEEKDAWLEYLKYYPSGFLAAKAADHLNVLGDFSYRNHQFGYRTVTLREIGFSPGSDDITFDSRASLRLSGIILTNFSRGDFQITVFLAGNKKLAHKRAMKLKNFILQEVPNLDEKRIKLSWFGKPETLYGQNTKYQNTESVRMYMTNWQ